MIFTIRQSLAAQNLRGYGLSDDGVFFNPFRIDGITVLSGSSTEDTINDVLVTHYLSASSYNEGTIEPNLFGADYAVSFSSDNPEIATIDSSGVITRVGDGVATIRIKAGPYQVVRKVDVTQSVGELTTEVTYLAGSLGAHLEARLDPFILGKNIVANAPMFSVMDHATPSFTRNPECWANYVDLTCISPSNSRSQNKRAGTAITPRHVINASHYPLHVGDTIHFVTQDGTNTLISRTITGRSDLSESTLSGSTSTDLAIYALDSDLPSTITPCKVAPANLFSSRLVECVLGRAPSLVTDQEKKALIMELTAEMPRGDGRNYGLFRTDDLGKTEVKPSRAALAENLVSGDSGSPSFLIVDLGSGDELVLITCWSTIDTGTFVGSNIARINDCISKADTQAGSTTGYIVSEADLSGFTDFS